MGDPVRRGRGGPLKQARFLDRSGQVRTGRVVDDGLAFGGRVVDPETVRLLAPCEPTKIVCVGLNYHDHIEETGREVPDRPSLFLKPPSAVVGPGDAIPLREGHRIDHEAELGVVIGEQCRNVSAGEAMEVVAGYTCVNDVSNRDDQRVERNWVRGKAFDGACPIGPVVASVDEVPGDAAVTCRVDGEVRQSSSIDELIWGVPELIEAITEHMTLEPGDVISTGTTSGVAPLSDGDVCEVEVEGVGTLSNMARLEP